MWLFLDLKLTGFSPTGTLMFIWKVPSSLKFLIASCYKLFNAIYDKVCCNASEEVSCALYWWSRNICRYCYMAHYTNSSVFILCTTKSLCRYRHISLENSLCSLLTVNSVSLSTCIIMLCAWFVAHLSVALTVCRPHDWWPLSMSYS